MSLPQPEVSNQFDQTFNKMNKIVIKKKGKMFIVCKPLMSDI